MTQFEAMCLSIAIEATVVLGLWALARGRWPEDAAGGWRLGVIAAAVTLVSHPMAWLANTEWLATWSMWPRFAVIEVSVALLEGVLYTLAANTGWRLGMALGVLANATSFGLGLVYFFYLV